MKTIITLTLNPTIDKSSSVDRVVPEHKLRCDAPRYEPGGGGINVSRAIRNLGGTAKTFYLAGGYDGERLRELLDAEEIDHQPVSIEGATRQNLIIYEEGTGQQYRFGMPGPEISEAEWKNCLDVLTGMDEPPDFLVASGSLPPGVPKDFYVRLARKSKEMGTKLVLDTSGEPLSLAVHKEGLFMVKPNLKELKDIAGEPAFDDESHMEKLAQEIIEDGGSEVIVMSLGAAGAMFVSKDGCERLRAPTVSIQSKVGAGDSMVAGIVLSLARGMSMKEAVRFGVASGAAAVMTPGTELCSREDTERLYEAIKEGE